MMSHLNYDEEVVYRSINEGAGHLVSPHSSSPLLSSSSCRVQAKAPARHYPLSAMSARADRDQNQPGYFGPKESLHGNFGASDDARGLEMPSFGMERDQPPQFFSSPAPRLRSIDALSKSVGMTLGVNAAGLHVTPQGDYQSQQQQSLRRSSVVLRAALQDAKPPTPVGGFFEKSWSFFTRMSLFVVFETLSQCLKDVGCEFETFLDEFYFEGKYWRDYAALPFRVNVFLAPRANELSQGGDKRDALLPKAENQSEVASHSPSQSRALMLRNPQKQQDSDSERTYLIEFQRRSGDPFAFQRLYADVVAKLRRGSDFVCGFPKGVTPPNPTPARDIASSGDAHEADLSMSTTRNMSIPPAVPLPRLLPSSSLAMPCFDTTTQTQSHETEFPIMTPHGPLAQPSLISSQTAFSDEPAPIMRSVTMANPETSGFDQNDLTHAMSSLSLQKQPFSYAASGVAPAPAAWEFGAKLKPAPPPVEETCLTAIPLTPPPLTPQTRRDSMISAIPAGLAPPSLAPPGSVDANHAVSLGSSLLEALFLGCASEFVCRQLEAIKSLARLSKSQENKSAMGSHDDTLPVLINLLKSTHEDVVHCALAALREYFSLDSNRAKLRGLDLQTDDTPFGTPDGFYAPTNTIHGLSLKKSASTQLLQRFGQPPQLFNLSELVTLVSDQLSAASEKMQMLSAEILNLMASVVPRAVYTPAHTRWLKARLMEARTTRSSCGPGKSYSRFMPVVRSTLHKLDRYRSSME